MNTYPRLLLFTLALFFACGGEKPANNTTPTMSYTTFQEDVNFLQDYVDVVVLEEASGPGRVAVSAALQGRVLTSSANGPDGRSYGWINRELFASRDTLAHMNPFGGEERLWLGPEGGQYSIFFPQGAAFTLDDWQTPPFIDLEHYSPTEQTAQKVVFQRAASLTNYSGFTFELAIERTVEILTADEARAALDLGSAAGLKIVAYRSSNELSNTGSADWQKETGLLSIWLLGMFNPSDATTVIVPFNQGPEADLGPIVNDTYFGKVPADRLKVQGGAIYFRGDGTYRSKIGLSPLRAKDVLGAYNADDQILTIVKYSKPEGVTDYVNSLWEIQEAPYGGDAVNSYNDGPPEPGKKPLGPFYELETSSPALHLKAGESAVHRQETFHFEGPESALEVVSKQVLGVSLAEIKSAFAYDH